MDFNTLGPASTTLGGFLRDRRARMTPDAASQGRRRTPGLRREEVAIRAGVSVTWYTWLEQGRGGPPSVEVLERLSRALELDSTGREALFLLAQQRPPPVAPAPAPPVPAAVRRVLDAMPFSPAFVRTAAWDLVAWNVAAEAVLGARGAAAGADRNLLRRLFLDPARRAEPHWEVFARFAVGVFRLDLARSGGSPDAAALAAELQAVSPEFRRFWSEVEMRGHGFGAKRLEHPTAGPLNLEFAAFAVDGAEGLNMIVYAPADEETRGKIAALVAGGSVHG